MIINDKEYSLDGKHIVLRSPKTDEAQIMFQQYFIALI